MADLVLDTGALVALQRDRARLLTFMDIVAEERQALRTCSPVLAEFLGRSPRGLRAAAMYVSARLEISSVNEGLARRAALLIQTALDAGSRAAPSAIDGLVAAEAERIGAVLVFDGDRADFSALADASGVIKLKELRELA